MFAVIPIVAIFLILILFVMFFSLPYWFYFLVAFLSYSYYEKLTYFVIINIILGVYKFVNRKSGPKFYFYKTIHNDDYRYSNHTNFNRFTEDEYTRACSILGVDKNTPLQEKKKRYINLLKKYHPDINPSLEAQEKTKELNKAWDIIERYGY